MGNSRFDSATYSGITKSYARKSVTEYTSANLNPNLDPSCIKLRESRDSDANPESNAIILGLDVTGSMGFVTDYIAKVGLGKLCEGIYTKKPISDPHIMIMGIGDAERDTAPLQVSQFESDAKAMMDQIEMLYVEGGGGGNGSESYTLPWYFAATRTAIDCFEKRNRKGYIFTIGDEPVNPLMKAYYINKIFGSVPKADLRNHTAKELYDLVKTKYHVFHIIADEGNCGKDKATDESWKKVLGENVIHMKNHKQLSEIIIMSIMIKEGMDTDEAMKTWDIDTAISQGINFRK